MTPELRLLFWELTGRCNLHCRHCRAEATDQASAGELDTAQMLRIARAIRATADPILILTGGEPLLRNDFHELAETCTGLFSRVALATNGTLVDNATARRLVDVGIQRVSISIDGADASTHDRFRGQPGSFDRAMSGYRALQQAGMSLQINSTVTRHNQAQLADLVKLALDLRADAFHLFVLVPVGCGVEIQPADRLDATQIETCLRWLHAQATTLRDRLHIKATCAPQYYRIMHEAGDPPQAPRHHGMQAVTRGCLAGSSVCFVSHVGDVQPCGYLPLKVGNLLQTSFTGLWSEASVFADLRDPDRLRGACGCCEHRRRCQGCRARAYAETGDYLAADPDCIYRGQRPPANQGASQSAGGGHG